jgi:hypothetical protein
MSIRGATVFAAGAILMSACGSTSLTSTPAPDPAPAVVDVVEAPALPSAAVPLAAVIPIAAPILEAAPIPAAEPEPAPKLEPVIPANIVSVPVADPPVVAVGKSDGADTKRAQERLIELGFWIQSADGDYGVTTTQAVIAFQEYYGLVTDGVLGDETAAHMTSLIERPRGRADAGTLVEINKELQVLFFVIDGKTEWILNMSSGSEIAYEEADRNTPGEFVTGNSVTRNGLHDVYRERPEGWWEGDLGEIYRPKYFSGGLAVHGSNHVPDYAASHGCVRVSVPAMDWIWESGIMPLESPVWVHEGVPKT